MHNQEDTPFFIEDDLPHADTPKVVEPPPWIILIIDDDPDVHAATMFGLLDLRIQQRRLHYLHAYSTAEARQVLLHNKNIAVILLDVVMDEDDSGLQLVNYIREILSLKMVRIILRTGQAGYAPEMDAIRDYDINDYKNKTELTQVKLFTTVTSAIRSYDQVCAITNGERCLELIIKASSELMAFSNLRDFTSKLIEYINELVDMDGDALVCSTYFAHDSQKQGHHTESGIQILSGTKKFVSWIDAPLTQVADKTIQTRIQKTFFEKHSSHESNCTTLYFRHIKGANLVIYLDFAIYPHMIDRHLLELFCSNVSVCLGNVTLNSQLHNLAFYDPLTGLANRLQLLQALNNTLRTTKKNDSVLALIDIDHFAETNDALGHQFGDFLLCSVGQRLQNHFGENCYISRLGNDIFALLGHEEIVSPEMVLNLFSQPFIADNQNVQLSATLGLIQLSEYELNDSEALKDANIALKRAKNHHRSGYCFFTRDMGVEIRERVRMMHALRAAFEDKRLFVVYQPQINMLTGETIGAEALLRWLTEDGHFIPPEQFIPIAEYSGLIINIGEWVLNSACFELMQLRALGYTNFQMAVNVSLSQFSHPLFLHSLERVLSDSGIPAHCLELEITESMAMTDPELLMNTLQNIKVMGVRISIDDFGTGFSSLSHLQNLNVDKLKIDRAFVADISRRSIDGSIAKMIVQLSQSLNLSVIAEGVETEEQAQLLIEFGCNFAQGFFYAHPKTHHELRTWLEHNKPRITNN